MENKKNKIMKKEILWNEILVNQLTEKDQALAYANHIRYFKERNIKMDTRQEFRDSKLIGAFMFNNSKEGDVYWIKVLDKIVITEIENSLKIQRKENYMKEKKTVQNKKEFIFFIFYCIISIIIFFFTLFWFFI
jgi:hypothetical protein